MRILENRKDWNRLGMDSNEVVDSVKMFLSNIWEFEHFFEKMFGSMNNEECVAIAKFCLIEIPDRHEHVSLAPKFILDLLKNALGVAFQ